ncbi:MAG TPA: hypothetical protein VGQ60_05860 [Nitrospiraceae bacterium]|nr:hypothetical protein [Nitrospiraceae bacterium]
MPIFFLLIILAIALNLSASPAEAQLTGTPDIYRVTINNFEISSNNGTSYTEIGTGGLTFNIAAASAGATVGAYFSSGSPLSASTTYNRMRVTISCTFQLRGCVGALCTQAGTDQDGGAAPAVEGSFAIPVSQVPACAAGQFTSQSPAEGQAGAITGCTTGTDGGLQATMKFNVTDTLVRDSPFTNTLRPGSPNVSFTCP